MNRLTPSILLFLLCGCSAGVGGLAGPSRQGAKEGASVEIDSRTLSAKVPEDSGKTTDESEGLPGYLVDPDMIAVIKQKNGGLQILAPEGSVTPTGQKGRIKIRAGYATEATPTSVEKSSPEVANSVGDDGSFVIELPPSNLPYIILSVSGGTRFPEPSATRKDTVVSRNGPFEFKHSFDDLGENAADEGDVAADDLLSQIEPEESATPDTAADTGCAVVQSAFFKTVALAERFSGLCIAHSDCRVIDTGAASGCLRQVYHSKYTLVATELKKLEPLAELASSACSVAELSACPDEQFQQPTSGSTRCSLGRCVAAD